MCYVRHESKNGNSNKDNILRPYFLHLKVTLRCFITLFLVSMSLYPQSRLDSLLPKLPTMKEDSTKVQAYLDVAWDLLRKDVQTTFQYADSAAMLAKKLGLPYKLTRAKRTKSFALTGMGKYAEAEIFLQEAMDGFVSEDNQTMILDTQIEFGWLKWQQDLLEESTVYFVGGLPLAKELKDQQREARIHNHLGGIYRVQKQYNKSIEHYTLALSLVEALDFVPGISACLSNLSAAYRDIKDYEKALEYANRALAFKEEQGDDLGAGRALNNIGLIYNDTQVFDKAEQAFQQAYNIADKVGDQKLISHVEHNQMVLAFSKKEYPRSIMLGEKILSGTQALSDIEMVTDLYKHLSKAHAEMGNYPQAYRYAVKEQEFSDSLYNKNLATVTNDIEAKYQNEQKTKEIALLASEKELQDLQLTQRINERNVIIVFATLAFLLALLLYNQYRIKQKSNKELHKLDELKSNFFANISHEFRTPLTLIKGPIEHLEQNPDEQLGREEIKMIRRNTNKVLGLVNQLLELSKIDQGKLQLEPTEGDIYKCLRAAASSFNSHAAQRHMDYRVRIPKETLWAAYDRDKLEKVVYNLLSNAFKFSEDGEMVAFAAHYQNDELTIQVSDSGKGISEDKLPFIFDRFYQVDYSSTKESGGSGIGLSLSKDLIELMDGTITVSSEAGKGTFFKVQLPLERIKTRHLVSDNGAVDVKMEPPKPFQLARTDKRNLSEILLIEDNEDMRQFIKGQLVKEYRVLEAINGEKGLGMAIAKVPDLIITDLMMPKMDGIELCKKLKTDVRTSHIPVIMLTARAGIENKIEGLETGADDYLTKPFDAKELMVRIKNLITQRKRLRNHFGTNNPVVDPAKVTTTSLDKKFLEGVLDLLEKEHSNAEFGVPQMQETLAMSKTQLHRKLKALTNESPGELLRNFRLKRAAQLLSQEADTVTQVAYQVGFNNLSYFAKCFKEMFGVSPSSY